MAAAPVFRFAPSPNGPLHLGHARSALLNHDMARAMGGRFRLRIEDVDGTRARAEHVASILADLDWLGLAYERPVRRQSEHSADYRAQLDRLQAMGLVYPSFLSRTAIKAAVDRLEAASGQPWPRDPDGAPVYPGTERDLAPTVATTRIAAGEPFSLRLDMVEALKRVGPLTWTEYPDGFAAPPKTIAADPAAWGDVILAGKFTPASYHLAVVTDDAIEGVTHVVRGHDLYPATSVHRLLQTVLDLPEPVYHHHSLILDTDGRKLSKSRGSRALRALADDGLTPDDVRRLAGLGGS
ncbi:tRNA glutamyl-Q(34) synthetase GluQRS [Oryzibacter oryziterrae]|uniref:tRNA glutamyl-Q(34) synthetase GluQRS n=1 Tax=Oryzibacter oryziterrae TaxID=2766474 RepID=UPI001F02D7C8|nr:tRNA glutamyl-Q(34) synthetase GluQRS [Oryzibacter oryziterrae]